MSRAKKASSSGRREAAPSRRGGPVRWLFGTGLPVALLVVTAGLFGAAWRWGWLHVRERVISSESYWLTPNNVEITPLPKWIPRDIRLQVFNDANLGRPLSIMEDDLVQRVRAAFSLHPWVAKVGDVRKLHPARVKIELAYRRPMCMVEAPGELVPVDAEGVVLPIEDFSTLEASNGYLRLVGVESAPAVRVGAVWGDDRVLGGAEIAAGLAEAWKKLGLSRIVAKRPTDRGIREAPTFDLLTRNETRIVWGHAPTSELSGDVPAKEKIARLERYFAEHGTLDAQPGTVILDLARARNLDASESVVPLVPVPQAYKRGT